MMEAECVLDGATYLARDFARLPAAELAQKRKALICPACRVVAFFRGPSSSGAAPCFGARGHEDWCTLGSSPSVTNEGGPGEEEPEVFNDGDVIVVDLQAGAVVEHHQVPGNGPNPTHEHVRGSVGDYGTMRRAASRHRLGPLLRSLVMTPPFRRSDQVIHIPGGSFADLTAREFFVRFDATKIANWQGKARGYWSKIISVHRDKAGALWLNTGPPDRPSVIIDQLQVPFFLAQFSIIEPEPELKGAWMLVLGTLRVSKAGKQYVRAEPGMITVRDLNRTTNK